MDKKEIDWIIKNYGYDTANRFIKEVEEETPENFTDEFKGKISEFLRNFLYKINGLEE